MTPGKDAQTGAERTQGSKSGESSTRRLSNSHLNRMNPLQYYYYYLVLLSRVLEYQRSDSGIDLQANGQYEV